MKKLGVFVPILLTIVLAFSMVPNAFAGTWIYYDDGTYEAGQSPALNELAAVRFSPPCGDALLLTARYQIYGTPVSFNVYVLDSDRTTTLFGPLEVTPTSSGWFDVDLSSYDIRVSGDFYICLERTVLGPPTPNVGIDLADPDGRSYTGTPGNWVHRTGWDIMIRAEVGCPVGGVVYSPDKLSLLSPLLIVTGLIGAIVIGSFVAKKRRA